MSRYYLYPMEHVTRYARVECERIEEALIRRSALQEQTGVEWRIIQDTGIGAAP